MKRRVAGGVLGTLLVAGVVAGAVVAPGYATVEPQLDGSNLWVANGEAGVIGLANTSNASIERVVRVGAADEAHQADTGTIIVDRDASTMRVVREGALQAGPTVPIRSGAIVGVRGDRIVVTQPSTGDVWRTTTGALAEGAPLGDPIVALGRGGVAVLSETGLLAASPGLGRVLRVDQAGEITSSDRAPVSPSAPDLQLTALGDDWVLYDAGSGVLSTRTWQSSIDATGVRLQLPGTAASAVLYATDDSLVRQQLGVPSSTVLASGADGTPARPLTADGCVFSAWQGGTAWRSCAGEEHVLTLDGVAADGELRIVQRGSATAAVAPGTGDAWAIDHDGARITGWQISDDAPEAEVPADGETVEETVPADPEPPVAEDDELGARPGAVTVLPVLLNDSDANGDPIVIVDAQVDREDASVSITPDGRGIRLVAPEEGVANVFYEISDGTASDSATAVVTTRAGNEPPQLVRPVQATLEAGGEIVLDALDGWVDPEGDPMAVVRAAADAPDRVSVRPDGRLEFRDGLAGAQREVRVTVTDGQAETTEAISLTVHAGVVPISVQPVTAIARVGQSLELEPLLAARGGDGELSLHNVIDGGQPVQANFADGTIRVHPEEPGLLRFAFVVTDGASTQNGVAVVRVIEATDASSAPVTLPSRVALPSIGSIEVDVDELAHDRAGGVVALTDASVDTAAVRAEVLDGEQLRLTLADDLDGEASIDYTVTNGIASATGTLRVSQTDAAAVQAPIARDDVISVRPGGLVDIPVLSNDEQPDGLPIVLEPELVAAPAAGLLFAAGDRMRYVAGSEPGTFTAAYAVRGPDGQTDAAEITLRVVAAAQTTNAAPVAPTVEARVVAGASVELTLPLSHADPNGDPVQLLGPSSAPALGFVTQSGRSSLIYQAGEYSPGTDEFRYRVVDDLGSTAEGTVRIAVVEPGPALPPVLGADEAVMRPDSTLVVPVLDNDRDPAGLPLEIVGVETVTAGAGAEERDGAVLVTAGTDTGDIGVLVTVENAAGSTATSWLRIGVDPEAPPPAPDVDDVQVAIQSIADADAVVIDPLAHASVRDGRTDVLEADIPLPAAGVELREDGALEIAIADRTRFVPFTVARTDDPSASSVAVVAVPGRLDALPQLRPGVAPLTVQAGETLEIAINDVVDTVADDGAFVTDASEVEASPSDGFNPVIDATTLRYVPPAGYYGPASISFPVTDGDSPTDPDGRVSTIVLPIDVIAGDDVPLTVLGSSLQLEQDDEREIDLSRVTRTPDPARLSAASWSIVDGVPPGFQASIEGSMLTVRALASTPVGTVEGLEVGVTDQAGEGRSGTVRLSVITSTRPLVAPVADAVTVQRGSSARVTPLDNDSASNPFPSTPLRIGAISDEGAAERGVTATLEGSAVTVSVADNAQIGTTIVRAQVLDGTGDPRRGVWSPITVTVQDVPDAPAPPVQAFDEHVDGVVTMMIEPPAANGSPITGYRIVGTGVDVACGTEPRCTIEDLPPGVELRLSAIAINALGESERSAASQPVHADIRPALVRGVEALPAAAPGSVRIRWQATPQPAGGTPIEGYLVRVTGAGADRIVRAGATERSIVVRDLTPGQAYSVAVAATNAAGVPDAGWRWPSAPVPFTAVGEPATTPVLITDRTPGTVTAGWSRVDAGGAARVAYSARIVPVADVAALECDSAGNGDPAGSTATSATLNVAQGSRVVVAVIADNGWHCSVSTSDPVFGKPAPADPSDVTVASGANQVRDNALDLQLTAAPTLPNGMWFEARVRQSPQATDPVWVRVGTNDWLTPTATSFAYGREASVDLRICAPSGAGSSPVCSDPTLVGSGMPLNLEATVDTCRPLAPLVASPPANAAAAIEREVVASYFVNGSWRPERPASEPVPAGATQVRATGVVTYRESGPHRDPEPTVAGCGL